MVKVVVAASKVMKEGSGLSPESVALEATGQSLRDTV